MPIKIIRGKSDPVLLRIVDALKHYEADNRKAHIDVYRQNPVSVRIRIVDPSFKDLAKSQRHAKAWKYLAELPEETSGDISMLVLVTPSESKTSLANMEFDDPVPSSL